MILLILIILLSGDAKAAPCQDYQIVRCIETCKMKCRGLKIRPHANESELLRVSYLECRDKCEEYCQKNREELVKELKTPNNPLADFVLLDQKANDCEIDQEAPSPWSIILSKILNYLLSLLALKEKNHSFPSSQDATPENLPLIKNSDVSSDPSEGSRTPPPLLQEAPKGRVKQLLVPEYVSPKPPKTPFALPQKLQPVDDSLVPTENTFRTEEPPQALQVQPPS